MLPHSRAPADTRTVELVRHGTCLRRVQGCGIGESVNLDNLGLEVTVHESMMTSVQKRMEPRRSLLGASVVVTDARNTQPICQPWRNVLRRFVDVPAAGV